MPGSDLLVINKIDLAPLVGADLVFMASDTNRMRGSKPWAFSNLRTDVEGLEEIIGFAVEERMLVKHSEKAVG